MIGIDLVAIDRVREMLERFGDRALRRFLNDSEYDAFVANGSRIESAAGFWAAKEAVAKALGCGIGAELGFHDIWIDKTEDGAPFATLSIAAAKRFKLSRLAISIAHEKTHAIAVALIGNLNAAKA